jgi:hypothetical protein
VAARAAEHAKSPFRKQRKKSRCHRQIFRLLPLLPGNDESLMVATAMLAMGGSK